jgi:hypothetical protein
MNGNHTLINYPNAHAFIANAATGIKGKKVEIWLEVLKNYRIGKKCPCGKCFTFELIPPVGENSFACDGIIGFFGETTIILNSNKEGGLIEVELPEITDIPFMDEYISWDTKASERIESTDEAYATVKKWFKNHST